MLPLPATEMTSARVSLGPTDADQISLSDCRAGEKDEAPLSTFGGPDQNNNNDNDNDGSDSLIECIVSNTAPSSNANSNPGCTIN